MENQERIIMKTFKNLNQKTLATIVGSIGVIFTSNAMAQSYSSPRGYVTVYETGTALKSGTGLCWNTSADKVPEAACGDIIAVVGSQPAQAPVAVKEVITVAPVEPKKVASIRVNTQVLFAFDSSALTERAKKDLTNWVNKYDLKEVRIEGHTDSFGSNSYNQKLSERRASVVKNYMRNLGVPESAFVSTIGVGKKDLVVECNPKTIKCEADNRRTEVSADAYQK
jgi:hypothetical protein